MSSMKFNLESTKLEVEQSIKRHDEGLRDINHKIHENPELGYAEFKAHDNVVSFLESAGIENITKHAYGLKTSFEAEYGEGGRLIVFNVEYDALPGIGHACGHNLIATASLASFLAVVDLLKNNKVAGRVRALGTPAEEGGGGKVKLVNAGAYKHVDACLMVHPMGSGIESGIAGRKTAHAAAAPQEGINALDAAVLAYNGISMLRQQILPAQRIHGIMLEGGEKANVIPGRSVLDYNVRGKNLKETRILQERVMNCFRGAALATGCTVEFEETNCYAEVLPNRPLCTVYSEAMGSLDHLQLYDGKDFKVPFAGSYSTDQGNVTQVCPGFHPIYDIPIKDGQSNHTKGFTAVAITEKAYEATLASAKGMAITAWKMLIDDAFAETVKADFEKERWNKD